MSFYQSILGGELNVQTFGDAIPDVPATSKDRVMHAHLQAGSFELMASDTNPDDDTAFVVGNNMYLSLIGSDESALTDAFNKLAEGGTVEMPLTRQFWGDRFGVLTDKFGVQWMVNIT